MPIKTYYSDGVTTMFDSDAISNGVCLGLYTIPAGQTFYKQWTMLIGASIRVMSTFNGDPSDPGNDTEYGGGVTVSYPSGVPTVSASTYIYSRDIIIWATGTPAIQSGAGMQAVNPSGNISLSPSARGLNYIGTATYVSQQPSTFAENPDMDYAIDGRLGWWDLTISGIPGDAIVVPIAEHPDGVFMVSTPKFFFNTFTQQWQGSIQATVSKPVDYTPFPALATPTVHVFAKPSSPGNGVKCALYDEDGTLAYDLLAGKLLDTSGRLHINTLDTSWYGLPISGKLGFYGDVRWLGWAGNRFSYQRRQYSGGLLRSGNSVQASKFIEIYESDEPPSSSYGHSLNYPADFEVINLNGY